MYNALPPIPLVVALTTVLLIISTPSHVRAVDVVFGQTVPLTGHWTPAIRYNAGLLAAFKEYNDRGGVYGRMLKLRTFDDGGNSTLIRQNIATLLSMPDVIGLISTTGTAFTEIALAVTAPLRLPIIAPFTGGGNSSAQLQINTR
eukprot:PhM_4_TR18763/c0_g2_i1/m.4304